MPDRRRQYAPTRDGWHLHFVVWRYESNGGHDHYEGVTSIELIALTESEALTLAADVLPCKDRNAGGFVVRQVTEHQPGQCPHFQDPPH